MTSGHPSPPRSWRAALVVACLAGTTVVCAILASEVRQADRALEATASQTLRDYGTAAGRMLGTEAIRRSREFRARVYGSLIGDVNAGSNIPPLSRFAQRAESLFTAGGYQADSLRGYLRIDVRSGRWQGLLSMADSARAQTVVEALLPRDRGVARRSSLLVLPGTREPIIVASSTVMDAGRNQYMYVVAQARSTNFRHAMKETMETVPLLPPSFTGTEWDVDGPGSAQPHMANDSLISVKIVAADGTVLYASPHAYGGPYRSEYQFQTGPGAFTIETVLRPELASRLVPAAVRSAGRSLYIGLGLVGCFLLAASFIAFWGEMSHQTAERTRSLQQLTTGLRHELNNALASVMLESQMLAASEEASPDARYAGAAIAEQAERMRKVVRRLDNIDHLPVVSYFDGTSMVDLAETRAVPDATSEKARAS